MSKHLVNCLEHIEIATSHLMIAMHEATYHFETASIDSVDPDAVKVASLSVQAVALMAPLLVQLEAKHAYNVPQEAMDLLRNYDPQTYLEARAQSGKN
jgi:hypothetical protein